VATVPSRRAAADTRHFPLRARRQSSSIRWTITVRNVRSELRPENCLKAL
jgi:hypothetical protein